MKPPPFEYTAAASLEEALAALAEHGDEAKVISGGQSLVPLLAFRFARPSLLVDINRLPGLNGIELDGGTLTIGALARHRDVELTAALRERCPMIVEAVGQIGHAAIRNRGTVGGSIAHADPAAEWTALALALDAELEVAGPGGTRTVAAHDFFVTYFTTSLAADEILVEARFHIPNGRSGSTFVELARRHGDFALAGVGALVTLAESGEIADARVGLIGVGATAVRARTVEAALRGRLPMPELLAGAASAVDSDIDPNSDVHASAAYRRHIAGVLVRRALETAIARAAGDDDGRA